MPQAKPVLRARTARLIEVIDAVRLQNPDSPETCDSLVREAFASLGDSQGCGRKLFNRDVVYGHGYRGRHAVEEFAAELYKAIQGDMRDLIARVKREEQEAVALTLQGNVTTREWLNQRLESGLVNRLSYKLRARFPLETREDIVGAVHIAIGQWGAEGSFDAHLRRGYQPSLSNLADWIGRKIINQLRRRGQDALLREMRGSRTDREYHNEGKIADDAMDVTSFSVVYATDDNGKALQGQFDIMDDADEESEFDAEFLDLARDCLRAARPQSHERLLRVFDLMCGGASRQEIADSEGITVLRAGHLTARVRSDLRESSITLKMAKTILEYVIEEPFSTKNEIQGDLEYPPAHFNRAIRLLGGRGLLTIHKGDSYLATDAGRAQGETLVLF